MPAIRSRILPALLVLMLLPVDLSAEEQTFSPEEIEFFEKKVRPILAARCYECHSKAQEKDRGGLVLDDRAAILTGGDSGPAATPREVDNSLLIEAVRYAPDGLQMPPEGKIPDPEIEVLTEWVRRGLPHPTDAETKAVRKGIDLAEGRKHWAFQPVSEQSLPVDISPEDVPTRIDHFLEAKRREHQLQSSPPAEARTLVRRVWFDLLGLPPSSAELEDWVSRFKSAGSQQDQVYSALIEQLLASPHYGERWGRHWLDLTRYADVGEEWREGEGQPWRYRDWVVKAVNEDLPYDEFVRCQLAADLQPNADPADNAALGFLGLSPAYWKELKLDHQVIKTVVAEEWEERLDALGGTFLGLTIGCARCHDHKFDPITAQDYYALAGVLASIKLSDRALIPGDQAEPAFAARAKAKTLEEELKKLREKQMPTDAEKAEIEKLQLQLDEVRRTPNFDLEIACGVIDSALFVLPDGKNATKLDYHPGEAQDVALHIRGNPARTGALIPRRFLSVLASDSQQTFQNGSGRFDLARAIVEDAAPLTARVFVNRVWKHHFGRGIVETPSNFGTQGSAPSHRELLDDLAARFIAHGWSLKWLHREIMSTAAYRQASYRDEARHAIDPDNQWLWRFTPRRLDVEAWRDALLAVSGDLDPKLGGPPLDLAEAGNHRRTLYGRVKRREVSEVLRLYDFPDPVAHSSNRVPTTTPLQQLFVLNGPFFQQQSLSLATNLLRDVPPEADRVGSIYQRLYQRVPTPEEQTLGREFVQTLAQKGIPEAEAWRRYIHTLLAGNEFLFID